jgi:hypothetical protein
LEDFDYPGNRCSIAIVEMERFVRMPKKSCVWIAVRPNSARCAQYRRVMSQVATMRVWPVLLAAILPSSSASGDPVAKTTHFVCDVGPLNKHLGQSDWRIYSCGDGRTLLFQSAPRSPPANFSIAIEKDSIERGSESTENRKLSEAAIAELAALSHEKLIALMRETEAVAPR